MYNLMIIHHHAETQSVFKTKERRLICTSDIKQLLKLINIIHGIKNRIEIKAKSNNNDVFDTSSITTKVSHHQWVKMGLLQQSGFH